MGTELELLKRIDEHNYLTEREHRQFYHTVEQALQRKSMAERCWEIMKKRNVDIYWLRYSDTAEQYNKHISKLRYSYALTETEFKTLKEGLE